MFGVPGRSAEGRSRQRRVAEPRLAGAHAVIDAIRTAEHELPVLSTDFSHLGWEESITQLMEKGRRTAHAGRREIVDLERREERSSRLRRIIL